MAHPPIGPVGMLVKRYRLDRGMTQMDAAQWLGLTSPQMISKVERGVCFVHISFGRKLCDALRIPRPEMARALQLEIKLRFNGEM